MTNNRKLESLGVDYLSGFVNRNNMLQAYFNSNDKTPLWDGEIIAYNKADSDKNSDILGKVPVQIKSRQWKDNESQPEVFRLKTNDLKLYAKHGGIILFVTLIGEDNNGKRVLYRSLPPFSIKQLLKRTRHKNKSSEQKTTSVEIYSLDEDKLYPMLHHFIRSSQKQASFSDKEGIHLKDLPKNRKLKYFYYGQSPIDIFNFQKENDIFPYIEDEHGIEIPIEDSIKISELISETDITVMIGNSCVFDKITRHYLQDGTVELRIGSGFVLSANLNGNKLKLNYERPNMLSEAIKGVKAMIELQQYGFISINKSKTSFSKQELKHVETMNLQTHLEELENISQVLKELGIDKDLDLSLFDEKSKNKLNLLYKGLILKERVRLEYDVPTLLHLDIANVHYLTLFFPESNEQGNLVDIFSETPWCTAEDENHNRTDVSFFTVFGENDWLKIDNCQIEAVIASYQRLGDEGILDYGANHTLVQMILAYDMAKDQQRKSLLLIWMQKFSDWNTANNDDRNRAILNDLLIKSKIHELDSTENETLINMMQENSEDSEICFGAAVLLKSKPQAEFYWGKLDKEMQEAFNEFPIYTLFTSLQ